MVPRSSRVRTLERRPTGQHEDEYLSEELESIYDEAAQSEGEESGPKAEDQEEYHTDDSDIDSDTAASMARGLGLYTDDRREDGQDSGIGEYHGDDSSDSASESSEHITPGDAPSRLPAPPLLPAHLLQPLPSPASPSTITTAAFKALPWSQLSRGQKQNARRRRREAGKRVFDRIKRSSEGTGIVAAGRFAQAKRGVFVPTSLPNKRVAGGRVQKQVIETSGRQKLLENRKRAAPSGLQRKSKARKA